MRRRRAPAPCYLTAPRYLATASLLFACVDTEPRVDTVAGEISAADPNHDQLAVGSQHACVITRAAGVRCWGAGTSGQLGDGALVDRIAPIDVMLAGRAVALATGGAHTCAALDTGEVACWGGGAATPSVVPGLSGVTSLAAGDGHTCALDGRGQVACWGANNRGQLGDGTMTASAVPHNVVTSTGQPLTGIRSLTAGGARSCALDSDRAVWVPVTPALDRVVDLAAGAHHTCALRDDGTAWCWGSNLVGQLGTGVAGNRATPTAVAGGERFIALTAADEATCGLRADGSAACWGWLGDNTTTTQSNVPVTVAGL